MIINIGAEKELFKIKLLCHFLKSSHKANSPLCNIIVQEAPLHQELHPPQPLLLLHPESCGRVGERRHPLQPNLALLQPAVTGEVTASVLPEPSRVPRQRRDQGATRSCVNSTTVAERKLLQCDASSHSL